MANKTYENWLEIDLQAIENNLKLIRKISGLPVAAVLKADAYGHGVLPVSRAAVHQLPFDFPLLHSVPWPASHP